MAEALVSDLLHQLASMKAKHYFFYADFERFESNLQFIMPMLSDAEEREANEEPVKLWLEKVKDASYKIDNILDRFNTEQIRDYIEFGFTGYPRSLDYGLSVSRIPQIIGSEKIPIIFHHVHYVVFLFSGTEIWDY